MKKLTTRSWSLRRRIGSTRAVRSFWGVLVEGVESGWPLVTQEGVAVVVGEEAVVDAEKGVEEDTKGAHGAIKCQRRLWEDEMFGTKSILLGWGRCGVTMEGEVVTPDLRNGSRAHAACTVGYEERLESLGRCAEVARED